MTHLSLQQLQRQEKFLYRRYQRLLQERALTGNSGELKRKITQTKMQLDDVSLQTRNVEASLGLWTPRS